MVLKPAVLTIPTDPTVSISVPFSVRSLVYPASFSSRTHNSVRGRSEIISLKKTPYTGFPTGGEDNPCLEMRMMMMMVMVMIMMVMMIMMMMMMIPNPASDNDMTDVVDDDAVFIVSATSLSLPTIMIR